MRQKHLLRTARNLLITALLGILIWAVNGCPLPMKMAFRQMERQNLVDRSEIVWTYRSARPGDRDMIVGLTPDAVHTYARSYRFYVFPRRDSGTLVPLPDRTRYQDGGSSYLGPSFLVPDPPARAVSAQLTVTLDVNDWREEYTAEADLTGGVFFFQIERKYHYLSEDPTAEEEALYYNEDTAFSIAYYKDPLDFVHLPYTLEFFDPSGVLLDTLVYPGQLTEEVSA